MAITSLDQLIAGMLPPIEFLKVGGTMEAAGVMHSLLYTAGFPGAGVAPTPGLNGAALTTYAGQIPFSNPGGSARSYLARLEAAASVPGRLMLADRLWHNSGIVVTTTGPQGITTPTWPARDRNGATAGDGVQIALEVSALMGNAAVTNTTLLYTNSAGTNSRVATIASFPASAQPGTFVRFELQAGDTGVQSIQAISLGTSYVSGTMHLVAYRALASLPVAVNTGQALDAVALGMPRLYDNSVPFLLWLPTATTATTVQGQIVWAQG